MRYAVVAAALAGAVAAHSNSTSSWGEVYVTEVVTEYTTYCPEATSVTYNGVTYTATEATTLTITNCPCTVTKPVSSSVVTSCSTCSSTPVAVSSSSIITSAKGTSVAATGTASGSGTYTSSAAASTSPITPATGAGSQLQAGVAAVLAVFGLVAAL